MKRALTVDEQKTAFNARAKASMDEFLRSKSWEEKVKSIERMRAFSETARAAMRETLEAEAKKIAAESPVAESRLTDE